MKISCLKEKLTAAAFVVAAIISIYRVSYRNRHGIEYFLQWDEQERRNLKKRIIFLIYNHCTFYHAMLFWICKIKQS